MPWCPDPRGRRSPRPPNPDRSFAAKRETEDVRGKRGNRWYVKVEACTTKGDGWESKKTLRALPLEEGKENQPVESGKKKEMAAIPASPENTGGTELP